MFEMPLVVSIWMMFLIVGFTIMVIALTARESRARDWLVCGAILAILTIIVWFFAPELEVVFW